MTTSKLLNIQLLNFRILTCNIYIYNVAHVWSNIYSSLKQECGGNKDRITVFKKAWTYDVRHKKTTERHLKLYALMYIFTDIVTVNYL